MRESIAVVLLGTNIYFIVEERQRRQAVADSVLKSIADLEKQRVEVFSDYVRDLASWETKSVYHQIYHANNAQLKLQNLLVQENQLIGVLIAGKK